MPLSIDLLIPTYNRSKLLGECLESVFRADKPQGVEWQVLVIDNNSSDDTRAVVESFIPLHGARLRYFFERQQGKSAALNRGIDSGSGELIAMIDDDEQIDAAWFQVAAGIFSDPAVDYAGGPYFPLWRAPRPDWLPAESLGVLGADDPDAIPSTPVPYEGDRLFLRGGNAIIRRSVIEKIGKYTLVLDRGRCEDHDMFDRLRAARATGCYHPGLIIFHVVPPERLTRRYFRNWMFSHARSFALIDRKRPQNVTYLGRIPRYIVGSALRAVPKYCSRGKKGDRFSFELRWWDLAGFIYGAYFDAAGETARNPG